MRGCSNETGPVGAVITGTGAPVPATGPWANAALAPANTMATEASNPLLIGLPFKLLISGPSDLKDACFGRERNESAGRTGAPADPRPMLRIAAQCRPLTAGVKPSGSIDVP
jgi:hypothetical protein